jgi:hypothetical protein
MSQMISNKLYLQSGKWYQINLPLKWENDIKWNMHSRRETISNKLCL